MSIHRYCSLRSTTASSAGWNDWSELLLSRTYKYTLFCILFRLTPCPVLPITEIQGGSGKVRASVYIRYVPREVTSRSLKVDGGAALRDLDLTTICAELKWMTSRSLGLYQKVGEFETADPPGDLPNHSQTEPTYRGHSQTNA